MKHKHILFPAMQFAAAAFFAKAALAETYCVNENHEVVAPSNCEDINNTEGAYFETEGPAGLPLGTIVHPPASNEARSTDDDDFVVGGFGNLEERWHRRKTSTSSTSTSSTSTAAPQPTRSYGS